MQHIQNSNQQGFNIPYIAISIPKSACLRQLDNTIRLASVPTGELNKASRPNAHLLRHPYITFFRISIKMNARGITINRLWYVCEIS